MSIAHLIEYIWILPGHVCNNNICLIYLIINPVENPFFIILLIHALGICSNIFYCSFNAEYINVTKSLIKRHEDKNKRFGSSRFDLNRHIALLYALYST